MFNIFFSLQDMWDLFIYNICTKFTVILIGEKIPTFGSIFSFTPYNMQHFLTVSSEPHTPSAAQNTLGARMKTEIRWHLLQTLSGIIFNYLHLLQLSITINLIFYKYIFLIIVNTRGRAVGLSGLGGFILQCKIHSLRVKWVSLPVPVAKFIAFLSIRMLNCE